MRCHSAVFAAMCFDLRYRNKIGDNLPIHIEIQRKMYILSPETIRNIFTFRENGI